MVPGFGPPRLVSAGQRGLTRGLERRLEIAARTRPGLACPAEPAHPASVNPPAATKGAALALNGARRRGLCTRARALFRVPLPRRVDEDSGIPESRNPSPATGFFGHLLRQVGLNLGAIAFAKLPRQRIGPR